MNEPDSIMYEGLDIHVQLIGCCKQLCNAGSFWHSGKIQSLKKYLRLQYEVQVNLLDFQIHRLNNNNTVQQAIEKPKIALTLGGTVLRQRGCRSAAEQSIAPVGDRLSLYYLLD